LAPQGNRNSVRFALWPVSLFAAAALELPVPPQFVSEHAQHKDAVEAVLGRAFGPGRFAKSSERVRERGAVAEPNLTRLALNEEGDVVGVCRIWRVRAGEAELYFLGPLAVDPAAQGESLGLMLAKEAIAAVRAIGGGGLIVVGAEAFFRQLGFTRAPEGRLSLPGPFAPERLLWLQLAPDGLDRAHGEIGPPR
jgi:predicted N-acetyltransferase YhbS